MKHGDFTDLAQYYINRPNYSMVLLEYIKNQVVKDMGEIATVADVGAGTGKLTENILQMGLVGYAVEPNEAMRREGMNYIPKDSGIIWMNGTAEKTNLKESSVDWILMGSAFHWANATEAMTEFYRILKPGGYFTAIWNPRNIEASALHMKIEELIYQELPNMKRVSSGRLINMSEMREKLLLNGLFTDLIYMEAEHLEVMTKERYMNIWKSVNDVRVQAGDKNFEVLLSKIDALLVTDRIEVPYLSRAWTVKSTKQ